MDPREVAEILSNSLGLKVDVNDDKLLVSNGREVIEVEPGYAVQAIALWVEPRKAWSIIRILYGDKAQARRAYEEYKDLPYTSAGKVCWLHKALAKAVNQRIKGADKEKVLSWLEDQVYRRWPNVCGEVDVLPEATKLVTMLNNIGISSSVNLKDSDVEVKVRGHLLTLKRRSPYSLLLIKELKRLAKEKGEEFEDIIRLIAGEAASCKDLAKMLVTRASLSGYPLIKHELLTKATEVAQKIVKMSTVTER